MDGIEKIYTPEELISMFSRIEKEHSDLTPFEHMEFLYILSKFGQDLEHFWDKHDKLGKLSVNFDV